MHLCSRIVGLCLSMLSRSDHMSTPQCWCLVEHRIPLPNFVSINIFESCSVVRLARPKSLQAVQTAHEEGSMGNGRVMTCVQPLGLSMCGEASCPSSNPPELQASAMRTEHAFASGSLYSRNDRLRNSVSHAPSIRNSEIAYGIFAEWFCAEIPGRKSLMEFLTIQSRYGIDSETPIAIRIPYGIGNQWQAIGTEPN